MDAKLAEIYGTNAVEDLETAAGAELAEKLAAADEMDLEGLDEETAEELAQEVLNAASEESEEEEAEEEPVENSEEEKVAQAHADYLGRIMAHSFTQELRGIEKEAGFGDFAAKAGGKVMKGLKAGGKAAGKFGDKAKSKGKAALSVAKKHGKSALKAGKKGAKAADRFTKKHHKSFMGGAAAAGAGAGFAAGHEKKSSEVSALDTLAEQRALEILAANGIDLNAEKTASEEAVAPTKYDLLASAVEARAQEMLEAAGYSIEESAEATEE